MLEIVPPRKTSDQYHTKRGRPVGIKRSARRKRPKLLRVAPRHSGNP